MDGNRPVRSGGHFGALSPRVGGTSRLEGRWPHPGGRHAPYNISICYVIAARPTREAFSDFDFTIHSRPSDLWPALLYKARIIEFRTMQAPIGVGCQWGL